MNPIRYLVVAGLALMVIGCGANKCDQAFVKCQYECKRTNDVCQVRGNDPWYCNNQIGNCTVRCDDAHNACKASSHWW